jgi:protein-tyrosine phosphatase
MANLNSQGAHVVVSLLERSEIWELELEAEADRCRENGMRFVSFPIPDRQVPDSQRAFGTLTEGLAADLTAGNTVVIHCRAGIGRSSLVAAAVLAHRGISVPAAFESITVVRGLSVPDTPVQAAWLQQFVASRLV